MATIANWEADGVADIVKEIYESGTPRKRLESKSPLLAMLSKEDREGDGGDGKHINIAVPVEANPGRSHTASVAWATSGGPQGTTVDRVFQLNFVKDYAETWLDEFSVMKMRSNRGAFVELVQRQINGLVDNMARNLSASLYGSGTGSIGRLLDGAAITGTTITLENPQDAIKFHVGGQYQFSATDGSALRGPVAAQDYVTVSAIDLDAGTLTTAEDLDGTIAALADTDYIYPRGDGQNNSTQLAVTGLAAWLPLAAPGATLFKGVDRTENIVALSGHRLDQSGTPAEESIRVLAAKMFSRGASNFVAFVSPMQLLAMTRRMGAMIEYADGGEEVDYGFSRVKIHTVGGVVRVFADPFCPDNRGYLLDMSTWKLLHMGGLPMIGASMDGLKYARREASDSASLRCKQYMELACYQPAYNGVFSCSLPGDLA